MTAFLAPVSFAQPALTGRNGLVRDRIVGAIRSDHTMIAKGTLHPLVAAANDEGRLAASFPIQSMSLVFSRTAEQQTDLENLLEAQQKQGSAAFHRWLTPSQFAARYGVSQNDLQSTAAWLRSQGFTVNSIPSSADRVDFSGTAAQVEAAFHTRMERYSWQGKEHWANATEISLPQALSGIVIGIRHLNSFRLTPHSLRSLSGHFVQQPGSTVTNPKFTFINQNGQLENFLAPADIQTIYDISPIYSAGYTGTGQYIGVMGQTDITPYMSDIKNFRSLSGLNPSNLPTQIVVPTSGTLTVIPADLQESDLDVEWAGAVAKDASILYFTIGNAANFTVIDSLQDAIQGYLIGGQYPVPVLSISYGACEQAYASTDIQTIIQLEQQANAQGQTIVASSGDNGSADCDGGSGQAAKYGLAVDFPASSPYTTAAGGTSFSGDLSNPAPYWNQQNPPSTAVPVTATALQYIPESAWNQSPTILYETTNHISQLSAGGGGISEIFNASPNSQLNTYSAPALPSSLSYLAGKPSWQTGTGVPSDSARDLPDVSLAADPGHDGYVICTEETTSSGALSKVSSCIAPPLTGAQIPYVDQNGGLTIYGGTSVAAPQIAGMIALWNQAAGSTPATGGVGNANYRLYQLAQTTPAAFHDVPSGSSNAVACTQGTPSCVLSSGNYVLGGYDTGTGYDLATGLGSVDAAAISGVWNSSAALPTPPPTSPPSVPPSIGVDFSSSTMTIAAPGSSGTSTLLITPLGGYTGTLQFSCTNLPTASTCSFQPSTVNITSSSSTTVTLTIQTTAAVASAQSPQQPGKPAGLDVVSAAFLWLPGCLTAVFFLRKRKSSSELRHLFLFLLLLGGICSLTACGSSGTNTPTPPISPSTPTGNSVVNVVISGTNNLPSRTLTLNLVVQ